MTTTHEDDPRPGFLDRWLENIAVPVRTLAPGGDIPRVHSANIDIAIAVLVAVCARIFAGLMLNTGINDLPGPWITRVGLGDLAIWIAVTLFCALFLANGSQIRALLVAVLYALSLGLIAGIALVWVMRPADLMSQNTAAIGPAILLTLLVVLNRIGPFRGSLVGIALAAAMLLTDVIAGPGSDYYGPSATSEPAAASLPDTEQVYAAQNALLSRQLAQLRTGEPGRTELFAVLGAGDPNQQVFAREVEAVAGILQSSYGAEGRIVRLVNDVHAPTSLPLLNRTNLGEALRGVAARMQTDEDVLFLFLTSHGGPDILSTRFRGVGTRDLKPEDIAETLDESGIRNAVIVISACYSGSFANELVADHHLIITAAAPDRNSFGCRDQNEWTDWGRAFFAEALTTTRDFRDAARIAQETVASRESAEGLTSSQPMMVEGKAIGPVLDRLLSAR